MGKMTDIRATSNNIQNPDIIFNGCKSGVEFEERTVAFLQTLGLEAHKTKANDGGIDIITYVKTSKHKYSFSIQCKYYNKPLGKTPIQEIYTGTHFYDKSYMPVVITNNRVTHEARVYAKDLGVEIIAGNEWDEIMETFQTEKQVSVNQHKGLMGVIIATILKDPTYYTNSVTDPIHPPVSDNEQLRLELMSKYDEAVECEREASRLEQQVSAYKQRSITLQKEAILQNLNYI